MNIIPRILNRADLLFVRLAPGTDYTADVFSVRRTKNGFVTEQCVRDVYVERYFASQRHLPVVVIFYGTAVVQKCVPPDSLLLSSITGDEDEFIYERRDLGNNLIALSFTRREEAGSILETLDTLKTPVICSCIGITAVLPEIKAGITILGYDIKYNNEREAVEAITSPVPPPAESGRSVADSRAAYMYARLLYSQYSTMKSVVSSSTSGCRMASLLFRRLWGRVALVLSLLLISNWIVAGVYKDDVAASNAELQKLVSRQKADSDKKRRRDQILSAVGNPLAYTYSYMLDRIAYITPAEILLEKVDIEPVVKLSQGKRPEITEDIMMISGSTNDAESVTVLAGRIRSEAFVREFKLSRVWQSRERVICFEMEVGL